MKNIFISCQSDLISRQSYLISRQSDLGDSDCAGCLFHPDEGEVDNIFSLYSYHFNPGRYPAIYHAVLGWGLLRQFPPFC